MKRLILLLGFLLTLNLNAQEYELNRVIYDGMDYRIKGNLKVTDSTMLFTFKKSPDQTYKVEKIGDTYKAIKGDVEYRFKFTESNIYKKSTHLLSIDSFDTFTKKTVNIIYSIREL